MKILFRILALFLIMPIVELALLLQVARWIEFWPTIGIIVVTGVTGSYLAKREGLSVWNRLQGRLNEGGLPGKEILDGVIILIAGALLITPGVITDVVGLIGLFPPTRALIRKFAMRRIKKAMREGRLQTTFGEFGGMSHPSPGSPSASGVSSPPSAEPPYGPSEENPDVGASVHGAPTPRGPAPSNRNGAAADQQETESVPGSGSDPSSPRPGAKEAPSDET